MSKCQPPWVAPLFNLDRDMRTRVLTNPSNNRKLVLLRGNLIMTAVFWWHDDIIKWKNFPRYWPFVQGTGEFPTQRPVTRSFNVFFDLRPDKQLSKQWWGWWFETPSCPLWSKSDERKHNIFYMHLIISQWTIDIPWKLPVDKKNATFVWYMISLQHIL